MHALLNNAKKYVFMLLLLKWQDYFHTSLQRKNEKKQKKMLTKKRLEYAFTNMLCSRKKMPIGLICNALWDQFMEKGKVIHHVLFQSYPAMYCMYGI